jgi:hypothetical protein
MKPVLIKQPIGMGDIFFTIKIAQSFLEKGHQVIHPVTKELNFFKNCLINNIEYVCVEDDFAHKNLYTRAPQGAITEHDSCIVIATDGADFASEGCGIMLSKYQLAGINYQDWASFFKFQRNRAKEEALLKYLGITKGDEFILINKNIGSKGHSSSWDFPVPNKKKVVESRPVDGFNLFDWCGVLQEASEFHIMETSLCYILEKLDLKATIFKLYHRQYNHLGQKGKYSVDQFKQMYTKHPWEHSEEAILLYKED